MRLNQTRNHLSSWRSQMLTFALPNEKIIKNILKMKEIHLMTNILQLRPLNLNVDGHHQITICLFLSFKNICCYPRSECCDPVLKENLRWELISYSELLWNLELTPPVIYCQTLNHQSQKPLISSSNVFDRLPWLQNVPKKNLDFQLEICQPCRLSRSNDFWSAERNWFHYFQIIRQQLLEVNFTEMEGNQETVY